SRRLPTRTARLDIRDQRTTTSKSETRVTVKPHPGPSFDCEPSQTHSLEGGPDDLLSRPQPVEARHLGPGMRPEDVLVHVGAPARTRGNRQHALADLWYGGQLLAPRHVVDVDLEDAHVRDRSAPLR